MLRNILVAPRDSLPVCSCDKTTTKKILSSPRISPMVRLYPKAIDEIWVCVWAEDGSHKVWKALEGCFQSGLIQWYVIQARWLPGFQPHWQCVSCELANVAVAMLTKTFYLTHVTLSVIRRVSITDIDAFFWIALGMVYETGAGRGKICKKKKKKCK